MTNVGIFYDIIIRMIDDKNDVLFDKTVNYEQIAKITQRGTEILNSGNVGVVQGAFGLLRSSIRT